MAEEAVLIQTETKRLLINGSYTLEFDPSDILFVERWYRLLKEFSQKRKAVTEQYKALKADKKKDEDGLNANTQKYIDLTKELCQFQRAEIDRLFGEGTSQGVFGDVLSMQMLQSFFQVVTPYVAAAREKKLEPYSGPKPTRAKHNKKVNKT